MCRRQALLALELLEEKHCMQSALALQHFQHIKKMGGKEFSQRYDEELVKEMGQLFEDFSKHNQSKNIFNTFRTPAIIFSFIILVYLGSGLEVASQLCSFLMGLLLLVLVAWAYIQS